MDTIKVGDKGIDNFEELYKLDNKHVMVKCKYCGTLAILDPRGYKYCNPKCINRNCINTKYKSNIVGKEFGNYVCIEESQRRVKLKCKLCGTVIDRERRVLKNPSSIMCENKECESRNERKQNKLVGMVKGRFECIQKISNKIVKVRCLDCNEETKISIYKFKQIDKGKTCVCNNIRCNNFDYTMGDAEITEEIKRDPKCLQRLGINNIEFIDVAGITKYAIENNNDKKLITMLELKKLLKYKE